MAAAETPDRRGVQATQRGFTYLGVLFAVVLMGVLLAGMGEVWHTASRRDKEAQLLFAGEAIRLAIVSYRDKSPGGAPDYPVRLEDLLKDPRFPFPMRHLRQLYRDPISNSTDWGLVRVGGRIVAVYSLSAEKPLKQAAFQAGLEEFAKSLHYSDWKFSALEKEGEAQSGGTPR